MKTFVIAEAGVNHNGEAGRALELIDVAAACGADAVKFQTFSADRLVRLGAGKADYQRRETGDGDQHSMLKKLEMSEPLHRLLAERCALRGIEFMSTPFDEGAVDFLVSLGMRRIKIASGELTNTPFLRHIAAQGLPMILSTGMADLAEVIEAVETIRSEYERRNVGEPLLKMLTLLHCTSNYPAAPADLNLRAMETLRRHTGLTIGYSDHSEGTCAAHAAVALGAAVVEKHFTLDRNLPGPDHKASIEPAELASLIAGIRTIELALGSGVKQPTEAERAVRAVARRSVTLMRAVRRGEAVRADDLALMRPGDGIAPKDVETVAGRRAARDLSSGTTLQWTDLS